MPKQRTPKLAAALAIPLLLFALGACGTTDETPDGDSGSGDDGGSGTQTQSYDDYQLAFTACMREQGVDMPDPNPDGSIEAQAGDGFLEAAETCQAELGEPPAPPGGGSQMSEEEQRAESLEIAACFRDNGIDVPDPGPGEMLTLPMDTPEDVFEECAPNGIGGSTSAGGS